MSWLLLLTLPLAAAFAWWHPRWAARRDWQAIQDDGSADTLKERFHFLRGAQRGILQALVSMVAATPVLPAFWPWVLVWLGVGVASLAYFLFDFNTRLSALRGLDPYYVSSDPRAAFFPDRYLYKKAFNAAPMNASGFYVQMKARDLLEELLQHVLIGGLAVGAALIVTVISLLS